MQSYAFVTDKGIIALNNEEHRKKSNFSIAFNEEGIEITFIDMQFLKAYSPIEYTDEVIIISIRDEHQEKALFPNSVKDGEIVI